MLKVCPTAAISRDSFHGKAMMELMGLKLTLLTPNQVSQIIFNVLNHLIMVKNLCKSA